MQRIYTLLRISWQVFLLSTIWIAADWFVHYTHFPVPANLLGLVVLLLLIFAKLIKPDWVRQGATWLLAEMLLFFVPAVMAIIKYPHLVRDSGLRIITVIFLSTLCVIVTTGWIVDKLHRFEVHIARQRGNRS